MFEPAIFDRIPADTFYDFGKQVFPELLAGGLPFYAMELAGAYWRDVGTPDEYRRATEDVLTGRVIVRGARATGVPEGTQIASDARIEAPVRVGEGAQVGHRVRIAGPSVVGDRVRIGDDAVLERAIVWNGAVIGAGATIRDSIVGERYAVAAGVTLDNAIVANEPQTGDT